MGYLGKLLLSPGYTSNSEQLTQTVVAVFGESSGFRPRNIEVTPFASTAKRYAAGGGLDVGIGWRRDKATSPLPH